MKPLRVGVVCDLREEGWHSMDLVADMLLEHLPAVADGEVIATRLCPPMTPRLSRLPIVGGGDRARLGDRLTGRLWDYPRWLAPLAADFDLFHIVDHSYAHLVKVLPAQRTVVTCHDVDAVQAALPGSGSRLAPHGILAAGVLDGLARAAHVACVSQATRAALLATGRVSSDRLSVIYEGVHPTCTPDESTKRSGRRPRPLLHVGSTIDRKRIDLVLKIFRGVRERFPDMQLYRAGGSMTAGQRLMAAELGVDTSIFETGHLTRADLADCYRSARLLFVPSEREGFGLPVVEAMACGTPVVASAIPALQEVGGSAAEYCPVGDVDEWVRTICRLLDEEKNDPSKWEARRRACIAHAARFDWRSFAFEMKSLYVALSRREPSVA